MPELPEWTKELQPLYCAWRLERHNNTRRMHWYRRIQKIKLKLAEQGICQHKIEKACRFLSNQAFLRGSNSESAKKILISLNQQERQLKLPFNMTSKLVQDQLLAN